MLSMVIVGLVVLVGGGVVAFFIAQRPRSSAAPRPEPSAEPQPHATPTIRPVRTTTDDAAPATDDAGVVQPDLALAYARLTVLDQASRALFASEYLAASQVDSWCQAYPEVLFWAIDSTWLRGLPADLVALINHYRQTFGDLATAVTVHNTAFLTRRMQEDADAFDRVERFPLTERQRQAIVTDEDTTLVIAGAGTGKTSTIIGKVDYLLRRKLATPDGTQSIFPR